MNRSKWIVAALVLVVTGLGTGCAHAQHRDRDNNPPGWRGGRGTNWENPPGPRGGPGTSRDARYWRDRDNNPPGWRGGPGTNWENPPGWRGGPGASPDYRYWRHGGHRYRFDRIGYGYYYNPYFGYWHPTFGLWNAAARCWLDFDRNPPGPRGGPGTNWENPPGWRGGPGASPDRFGRCR